MSTVNNRKRKREKEYKHSSSHYNRVKKYMTSPAFMNERTLSIDTVYESYDDEVYDDEACDDETYEVESRSVSSYDDENSILNQNEMKETTTSMRNDLHDWALKHNIPHTAVKDLLATLNKNGIENLPKDPRTLLMTPRMVSIQQMGGGEYWHYGLAKSIQNAFGSIQDSTHISLSFNMDGLQPKESSNYQVWPILAQIFEIPKMKPLVIGIYAGYTKPPSSSEYLAKFCDELIDVVRNGVNLNEHTINVKIRCFICDTPARSFIKGEYLQQLHINR